MAFKGKELKSRELNLYYTSQWGLENEVSEAVNYNNLPIQERLEMLPPHLRDAVESSPELKEFIINTPIEELSTAPYKFVTR